MKSARADHAVLYYKDQMFVFGGMSLKQGSSTAVESLTSCEVYSIKDDQWQEIPPMANARQSFSACLFNEKYIFVFGGKVLGEGATLRNYER
jgi:N-acetylneuraminic acid mutarotase